MLLALLLALSGPPLDSAHHIHLEGTQVVVDSQWNTNAAETFTSPLPASAVVEVRDARTLRMTLPLRDAEALDILPLPLPEGSGVHRITFDRDLTFRPRAPLELTPRGTQSVSPGLRGADLRRVDATFGDAPRGGALARYVRTDDLANAGGLSGRLRDSQGQRLRMLLLGSGLLVFFVAALLAITRAVTRRADVEVADALLAQEIEALDPR